MSVGIGILFHTIGAASAALCYTPQKKVQQWSWQTFWLIQAAVCWFILPIVLAFLTIPNLLQVLTEASTNAMWHSFLLGMAYGIGGTAFGIAIKYIGFSLTYAIAVGISCVLGTLLGPLLSNQLVDKFSQPGAMYIIIGLVLGVIGIAFTGWAGHQKEIDLEKNESTKNLSFSLKKGLPICMLAGILSAFYGLSLDAGKPIADVAKKYGAGNYSTNVIYIFSNIGAFITTFFYCIFLHKKNGTFNEHIIGNKKALSSNYLFALLTGLLWYGQFFFYGLGTARMGNYEFTSWAIHMILLVLISMLVGLLLKEWKKSSRMALLILSAALAILVLAVLLLAYGNYKAKP